MTQGALAARLRANGYTLERVYRSGRRWHVELGIIGDGYVEGSGIDLLGAIENALEVVGKRRKKGRFIS